MDTLPVLPERIAVVCHDAGGANMILSMLETLPAHAHQLHFFMQGPAEKLWRMRFPDAPAACNLDEILEQADVLISGTGWASDLEYEARVQARARKLSSIAVLDHWVNYAERFVRDGQTVLPDQIWVCDSEANGIAKQSFPTVPVVQLPNFYLQEQVRSLPAASAAPDELLYVMEPARSNWGGDTAGEFQALDFFISMLPQLHITHETAIRLRPHPSDPPGKYAGWLAGHAHLNVSMDDSRDLHAALARARRVAGCESFALVVALAAGRQVYCTLPPWAPPCRLPHKGLIHLKDLRN